MIERLRPWQVIAAAAALSLGTVACGADAPHTEAVRTFTPAEQRALLPYRVEAVKLVCGQQEIPACWSRVADYKASGVDAAGAPFNFSNIELFVNYQKPEPETRSQALCSVRVDFIRPENPDNPVDAIMSSFSRTIGQPVCVGNYSPQSI